MEHQSIILTIKQGQGHSNASNVHFITFSIAPVGRKYEGLCRNGGLLRIVLTNVSLRIDNSRQSAIWTILVYS